MAKAVNRKEAERALRNDLAVRVDDAALLLDIDRKVAYAAVREGTIPSIRIGRLIRIPTAGLRKLLGISPSKKSVSVTAPDDPENSLSAPSLDAMLAKG
jgi:excisionase family DNA binding protein